MIKPSTPAHWETLSSQEKIDAAYQVVRQELTPEYLEVLRNLDEGVRLNQAFALWRMARSALCRQAMERGLDYEDAMREAAQGMLRMGRERE